MEKLIDQLLKNVEHLPIDNSKYSVALSQVASLLQTNPRYSENLLCFYSGLHRKYPKGSMYSTIFDSNNIRDIQSLLEKNSFLEIFGEELQICNRYDVEYNKKYKQLCVAAIIETDTHYVLLKNNSNHRLANKITMVQGHVDFSQDIYNSSTMSYLKRTMVKELNEELQGIGLTDRTLESLLTPAAIINDKFGDNVSIEHIGIVFRLKLDYTTSVFLSTNEPTKHNVTRIVKEDIAKHDIDRWCALAIGLIK